MLYPFNAHSCMLTEQNLNRMIRTAMSWTSVNKCTASDWDVRSNDHNAIMQTLSWRLLMPRLDIRCRWIVSRCFLLQNRPVKHVVIRMTQCSKQNTKQLAQIHVVSSLFKPQASAVVQIHCKLCWETLQNTDRHRRVRKITCLVSCKTMTWCFWFAFFIHTYVCMYYVHYSALHLSHIHNSTYKTICSLEAQTTAHNLANLVTTNLLISVTFHNSY